LISAARRTVVAWRTSDAFTSSARRPSTVLGAAALAIAAAYSYAIVDGGGDLLVVVPVVAAVVVVAVAAHPIVGLYLFFGGAILFEQFSVDQLLPITAYARFFQNVSAFTPLPVRLSPADLLALLTLASWSVRVMGGRVPKPRLGPLGWAVAGFGLMFVAGALFGVAREDFNSDAALAELRAPMHLCIAYFLAANLVRRRQHVEVLLWTFVVLVGIKALQGILTYLEAVDLSYDDLQAVTGHEDVVFFGTAVSLAVALVALGVRTRLTFALLAIQPLILLTLVLTERRVGFIGLGVALVIVTILTFAVDRRRALVLATVLVVAAGAYVVAFWDASGAIAEPVRAVKSIVEPSSVSTRDMLSNVFREIENRNIARTVRVFPLTGVGLGQQYLIVEVPQWLNFGYWRYMTHNGLLWIWLKAGPLGAFMFWFLVARAVLLGSSWFGRLRDDRLQWVPALPVILIATQVIFAAVELGIINSRTMIVVGATCGFGSYFAGLATSGPERRAQARDSSAMKTSEPVLTGARSGLSAAGAVLSGVQSPPDPGAEIRHVRGALPVKDIP
jgi:hypothetical protein